jgi:hypothetical protein
LSTTGSASTQPLTREQKQELWRQLKKQGSNKGLTSADRPTTGGGGSSSRQGEEQEPISSPSRAAPSNNTTSRGRPVTSSSTINDNDTLANAPAPSTRSGRRNAVTPSASVPAAPIPTAQPKVSVFSYLL